MCHHQPKADSWVHISPSLADQATLLKSESTINVRLFEGATRQACSSHHIWYLSNSTKILRRQCCLGPTEATEESGGRLVVCWNVHRLHLHKKRQQKCTSTSLLNIIPRCYWLHPSAVIYKWSFCLQRTCRKDFNRTCIRSKFNRYENSQSM